MSEAIETEIVIIGAGLAGLACALHLAPRPVTLLAKSPLGLGAASPWAQGGIAAALAEGDNTAAHAADTIAAGAGLVDRGIAEMVTASAPRQIEWLSKMGVPFDHDDAGALILGREAAHSHNRIARVGGDTTGYAITLALIEQVLRTPSVRVLANMTAQDLLFDEQGVSGVVVEHSLGGAINIKAGAVVLATGGIGQLYQFTTNPREACGEGLGMALRAGATAADLEFVQFHPTALLTSADPLPLLTEALRGEGAVLLNKRGERFMTAIHADAELAPRDVVARAIWAQQQADLAPAIDCRALVTPAFAKHFATVFAACQRVGLDPATDVLPVTPAAHYHMGGVAVDAHGRTSKNGLWACGEVASTGLHGANRLASNSLLEALVFAERVAQDLHGQSQLTLRDVDASSCVAQGAPDAEMRQEIRQIMFSHVGLVRSSDGLNFALSQFEAMAKNIAAGSNNMLNIAQSIAYAALQRCESRGAHARQDYPLAHHYPARQFFRDQTLSSAVRR